MALTLPALDPNTVPAQGGSGYPEPFRSRVLPREKRSLAAMLQLTHLGINLTTLPPGKESSMRHFHTHEDEFVFVLEGSLVLVTDEGEQTLEAGTCAGFPAGSRNGHHFINRSSTPTRYLEVSNHDKSDGCTYSDVDLAYVPGHDGTRGAFTRKDGTPY